MEPDDARAELDRLIRQRGENYGALSRMLGRNPAYIQQFIKRGTPRWLDERDRRALARFFGVDEAVLGGEGLLPAGGDSLPVPTAAGARRRGAAMALVGRLSLGASAGAGSLDEDERPTGAVAFDPLWLRLQGLKAEHLSILHVDGDSMASALNHGDDIMVDRSDAGARLRDGIYVLRFDDVLMVKRIALSPRPRGDMARSDVARRDEEAAAKPWVLTISSDNPLYPSWEDVDPGLVEIVGRVVWVGRRLS